MNNTIDVLPEVNIMEYMPIISAWAYKQEKELSRYGMNSDDFTQEIFIKWTDYKGKIEMSKVYQSNTKALILLICYRFLVDLRRKFSKNICQSIDVETFKDSTETIADTIADTNSIDLSLMFEMADTIPDKNCTKNFSYKQLFQIILEEGNEPSILADILDVSTARISQITKELIRLIQDR